MGFRHLDVLDVVLSDWCEKQDLKEFTAPCMDCGESLTANIPFAGKDRRGLRADPCECGNYDVPFTYVDLNYGTINLNSLMGYSLRGGI